jgi:hypothetical protein
MSSQRKTADRHALIRFASSLPKGNAARRVVLASLCKTSYTRQELAEIDSLDRLIDPETRAEVSDWGVNTIRELWPKIFRRYVDSRTPVFDSRELQTKLIREEFARIKKGRLGLDEYLRVSRAGSNFGLDRKMRMAIWAHYASKNWRRARMSSQKTASMIRMDGTYI